MQDLRLAFRSLRASPGVSTIVIASLALGIGANAAIFTLFSSLVLRPLPVREPDRLALLSTSGNFVTQQQYSHRTLDQIRRQARFVEGVFGYTDCCGRSILAIAGDTTVVDRQYVTGDYFTTLGIQPVRGRLLTVDDDREGAPAPVAVISHRLWRERFGQRDDVIGTKVVLDQAPLTIVGVTPERFLGLEVGRAFDVLVPLRLAPTLSHTPLSDDTTWLNIVVRLKRAYSLEQAAAALRGIQPEIRRASVPARANAATFLAPPMALESFEAGTSALRQRFARPLVTIFIIAALVLLIASANIGNLLLARSIARGRVYSIRTALGAPRWTLVRQIAVESAVLATVGAMGGFVLAVWGTPLIVRVLSTTLSPIELSTSPDWRVLFFAIGVTAATALVCALAPAIKATRIDVTSFINETARVTASPMVVRSSDLLIVGQVAVSLVLIVTGSLFVQTFRHLSRASPGFEPDGVVVATVNASAVSSAERARLMAQLANLVRMLPGVVAAGAALNPPLVGGLATDFVVSAPGTLPPPNALPISRVDAITPGWLASYGVRIVAGRAFSETDEALSPKVMLVNSAFVAALFPGQQVVDKTLAITIRSFNGDFPWGERTIVGVTDNTVQQSAREAPRPAMFIPLSQFPGPLPQSTAFLGIRTDGASTSVVRTLGDAIKSFNGDIGVTFQRVEQQLEQSVAEDRLVADLSSGFAGLGLILSTLGLYGVTAYAVERRRREFSIRVALGATPLTVTTIVLRHVALLVAIGLVIGSGASLASAALVRSLLFGVDPRDPFTLAASALLLTIVGGAAVLLPSYYASKADPAAALKEA